MRQAAIAGLVALGFALATPSARAVTLSAGGGLSFGGGTTHSSLSLDSPSLYLSGELTAGLGELFQLGGFFDYNKVTGPAGIDATQSFYGGVARLGFGPVSDLFLDLKAGLESMGSGTDTTFGFGIGAGYAIELAPLVALKPRLGFRSLPFKSSTGSFSHTFVDAAALVSFGL